jgi:hypothetical protein
MIDRAGNTFAEVMQAATDEWRLVFARLVREYFDATVLPTPLNVLEIGVNWVMKVRPTIRYTLMNSLPPSLSLSLSPSLSLSLSLSLCVRARARFVSVPLSVCFMCCCGAIHTNNDWMLCRARAKSSDTATTEAQGR